MTQRKQDDIRLPQLRNRLRMRKISKKVQLRSKAGLDNGIHNFGINLAGQTYLQARSEVRRFGTKTGQRLPQLQRIPV